MLPERITLPVRRDTSLSRDLRWHSTLPDKRIYLSLEYGLFEEGILDNQKYHISSIDNNNESVLPRETSLLFEVYVPFNFTDSLHERDSFVEYDEELDDYIETYYQLIRRKKRDEGDGLIYFRKIKSIDSFLRESKHLSTKLLLDCEDLSCGFAKPFNFEVNVPENITNDHGDTYPFAFLFTFLHQKGSHYGMSKRIFINEFSKYYQPKIGGIYNFTSKEIESLLDRYLIFNLYTGFYSGYDSLEYCKGGYYLLDKTFFKILYIYLSKDNTIERIYQIVSKLKVERQHFEVFTLTKEEFRTVKSIFLKSKNIDDFIQKTYDHFKKKLTPFDHEELPLYKQIYKREIEIIDIIKQVSKSSRDYYVYSDHVYRSIKYSPVDGVISFIDEYQKSESFSLPNWDSYLDNYIINYLIKCNIDYRIFVYSKDELDKYRIVNLKEELELI